MECLTCVKCSKSITHSSWTWENQLQLEDIELSEGNGEEQSIIRCAGTERNQFAHVLLWLGRKEVHLVHGGNGANEEYTKSTRSCCSGLDSDIFLRLYELSLSTYILYRNIPWDQSNRLQEIWERL